jgi:hypothetical protein
MNSRLEQFVRDHREEFDSEEPGNEVWEKINAGMNPDQNSAKGSLPDKKKPGAWVRFSPARWSAAAAVVLLMAGAGWYFSTRTGAKRPIVANTTQHPSKTTVSSGSAGSMTTDTPTQTENSRLADSELVKAGQTPPAGTAENDNSMDEEMYHYARLVEIKHNQLKAIEKDEPLLYKQFASDVSKLDSVYHSLQSQLPKNPNREQLLEAMLQNLQLQMGLLNHQLDIIKQINHSKKTEYEKAFKTA